MARCAPPTWSDILELSAALAGLAKVSHRFIPLSTCTSLHNRQSSAAVDAVLSERTVALARAELYNFLSAAFIEPPSTAFVRNLHRSGALVILADKGLGGDDLRHWAQEDGSAAHAAELAAAYTQLLTRPGPGFVSPTASGYLGSESDPAQTLNWGPAAAAAAAAYREAGLVVGCNGPCPPDHLAMELQFMHHCAAREAAAWSAGDVLDASKWRERQRAFLKAHLLPWVNTFRKRVAAVGAHPYYQALADLTGAFLAAEVESLAAVPSVARRPPTPVG